MRRLIVVLSFALMLTTAFAKDHVISPNEVYNLECQFNGTDSAQLYIPMQAVESETTLQINAIKGFIEPPAVPLGPAIEILAQTKFTDILTLTLPFQERQTPLEGVEICVWYHKSQNEKPVVIAEKELVVDREKGTVSLEISEGGIYQVGIWNILYSNWPPASFILHSPQPQAVVAFNKESDAVQFSWQPAVDPNSDEVSYKVIFAYDAQLQNRIASLDSEQKNHLTVSAATLKQVLQEAIYETLYWSVEARDKESASLSLNTHAINFTGNSQRAVPHLLFDYGSEWEYNDSKNLDGKSWKDLGYKHHSWRSGKGILGFGGWEGEEIATELDSFRTTYYFRKKIVIDEEVEGLTARVKYDDGFVFYVNGQRVYFRNMKNNPDYDDYARSKSSSQVSFTIDKKYLVMGENVLSVEVHQSDAFSSDIAFDARVERGHNSAAITWGPWLTLPLENSITVVWESSESTPSELHYGTTESLGSKVSSDESTTYHKLTAPNLERGTTYYYKVVSGDVHSSVKSFQSEPRYEDPVTIGIYGDSRTHPDRHQIVIKAIAQNDATLVVHSGDVVAAGYKLSDWYDQFLTPTLSVIDHIPMIACRGNHDGSIAAMEPFFPLPATSPAPEKMYYYAFTYGSLAIITVDTETNYKKGSPQYNQLEADLRKYAKKYWLCINFHRPAYSSGKGHGGIENPKIGEEIVPLLEKYGVDWVFNGHDHFYERSFKDGVHYLLSGGGGAPSTYGGVHANPYKANSQDYVLCYSLLKSTPTSWSLKTYSPEHEVMDEVERNGSHPEIHILQPKGTVEVVEDKGWWDEKYSLKGPSDAFTAVRGGNYPIRFNAKDIDSDAKISLHLTSSPQSKSGILIAENISESRGYEFNWNVPADIAPGTYYIYGVISDGKHQADDHSPFKITVK